MLERPALDRIRVKGIVEGNTYLKDYWVFRGLICHFCLKPCINIKPEEHIHWGEYYAM